MAHADPHKIILGYMADNYIENPPIAHFHLYIILIEGIT